MNILKQLFYKLRQNKGRLFLISLLYASLFSAVILLLVFRQSSGEQISFMKTYIANRIAMVPRHKNIEIYVAQDMEKLECVRDYNLISYVPMRFRGQKPYIPDQEAFEEYRKDYEERLKERGMRYEEESMRNAQLFEVNQSQTSHFFLTKGYRLIEGEPILPGDQNKQAALVSREFAEANHLKIGDTVKLQGAKNDLYFGASTKIDLQIKGIFEYTLNGENLANPREHPANYIFAPIGEISEKYRTTFLEVDYFLKEGEDLLSLKEEIREKCFWEPDDFLWTTTGDWYGVVSRPMETMRLLSGALLTVMSGGLLMIVFLLVAFRLKGDSYETGILLSMGESRGRLALFVLLEEWIPIAIGVLAALAVGAGLSGTVGEWAASGYEDAARELIEDKNAVLDVESPETKEAVSEIGRAGRQIRMNLRYDGEYRLDRRTVSLFLVLTLLLLPVYMAGQVLYWIRFYSVKKILLA